MDIGLGSASCCLVKQGQAPQQPPTLYWGELLECSDTPVVHGVVARVGAADSDVGPTGCGLDGGSP
jgi:hypothetical protein